MHLSAEAAMDQAQTPSVGYVAARANEIACKIAPVERLDEKQAAEFECQLEELKEICLRSNSYWSGRWALNCIANVLQVRIKAYNFSASWTQLEQLRNAYFDSDISNGWDIAARQTITQLEGMVRVLFSRDSTDFKSGIELLARAFMTRLGRRQRLEGIRDVGFTLAIALRAQKKTRMIRIADSLENLMTRTMDGTSVMWHWRAVS